MNLNKYIPLDLNIGISDIHIYRYFHECTYTVYVSIILYLDIDFRSLLTFVSLFAFFSKWNKSQMRSCAVVSVAIAGLL